MRATKSRDLCRGGGVAKSDYARRRKRSFLFFFSLLFLIPHATRYVRTCTRRLCVGGRNLLRPLLHYLITASRKLALTPRGGAANACDEAGEKENRSEPANARPCTMVCARCWCMQSHGTTWSEGEKEIIMFPVIRDAFYLVTFRANLF